MKFGRSMLEHWLLDPDAVYLNHGTVGVTPRQVLDAQQQLRLQIERHPAKFMLRELMSLDPAEPQPGATLPRLRVAADKVGAFLGCRGDDLAFVDNASAGINAVLRSLHFEAGDEIVLFDQAYGAVARTAAYVARAQGAQVVTLALRFPIADAAQVTATLEAGLTPRARLVIVDHISSETALIMPVAELSEVCRDLGIAVLVDGAHAPGAIDVDIPALGVDWYVANLHKWAFAPRGCGVLWAAREHRQTLHPSVISWGLDTGWLREFDWTGTRDPTPFLCAPDGIEFMASFLGIDAMRQHNHALVWRAAQQLAARWGQPWSTPESMTGCMATLPLPQRLGSDTVQARRLQDWLLFERQIEVPVITRSDRLWLRVSAQVYNEDSDIERLGDAVDEVLARPSLPGPQV
jgi:isopenicillin-N epimerase